MATNGCNGVGIFIIWCLGLTWRFNWLTYERYILYDFWNGNAFYGPLGTLVGVFAPMFAIIIMKYFHLSTFFEKGKVNFRHIIFLIVLSLLINTIVKLLLYIDKVKDIDGKEVEAVIFLQSYLTGDILGGLVFIIITLKILLPMIVKLNLAKSSE